MRAVVSALLASLALTACDRSATDKSDAAFDAKFAAEARDLCLDSAGRQGVAPGAAQAYCDCFVDKLNAMPHEKKMYLKAGSDEIFVAINACRPKLQG